jgi:thiopurine S-methyltransferase
MSRLGNWSGGRTVMEADFWLDHWRRNQIGFHQNTFNRHLVKHWRALGVRPGARIFVPLCGKSRDLIWLSEQGYSVVGCEISGIAVESFFSEAGLEPQQTTDGPFQRWSANSVEILLGDFFSLSRNCVGWFDAVYDRASLVALPQTMRPKYARTMTGLAPPDTPMLLITVEYPQHERHGPPFSVPESEVRDLFGGMADIELLESAPDPGAGESGPSGFTEQVYRLRMVNRG